MRIIVEKIGNVCDVNEFQIDSIYKNSYMSWLKNKDNIFEVSRKMLFIKIFLEQENIQKIASNFYILMEEDSTIMDIMYFDFNKKIKQKKYYDLLETLISRLIKIEEDSENSYRKIYIYFPVQIANIFSKKRYNYQINSFHMESLRSYKSLNKTRKSAVEDWCAELDTAVYCELLNNNSMTYQSNLANVDYLKLLIHDLNIFDTQYATIDLDRIEQFQFRCQLPSEVLESDKNIKHILDFLDRAFFIEVVEQQKALKLLIEYELDAIDSDLNCEDTLNILEKNAYSNKNTIKTVYESIRKEPWFESKNKRYYMAVIENIFGNHSPYYDEDDNNFVFFGAIRQSFMSYYDQGFRQKDLRHFFNREWIASVKNILTR